MPPHEEPSVSVRRPGCTEPGSDPTGVIVWVSGEHDFATRFHLSATIDQAALLDNADVVVDLGGVTFMDASTAGALVLARNRLRGRSRSLSVRAPSPRARRLLDLCGLGGMIDESPSPLRPPTAPALDSWVAVPPLARASDSGMPATQSATSQEHARTTAAQPAEPTASIGLRGPPW